MRNLITWFETLFSQKILIKNVNRGVAYHKNHDTSYLVLMLYFLLSLIFLDL